MTQTTPIKIDIDFDSLPQDIIKRHEVMVDILGQYVMWLRNWSVDSSRRIVTTHGAANQLGAIRWKRYESVAALSPSEKDGACKFSEATVDRFIELLLTLFSATGTDQRLGTSHAIRFKLDMEILEVDSEEVVAVETLNRGGRKFFADYFGRWLNRQCPPTTEGDPTVSAE